MINMDDMDITADGSMVRVDVITDGSFCKNDPTGQFVAIDQALLLEAQGRCRIRRNKNRDVKGGLIAPTDVMTDENGRVMVEYSEQVLIDSYGKYGSYKWKEAALGEKVGKWKIVRSKQPPSFYETQTTVQDMLQEDPLGLLGYQTKGAKNIKKKRVVWIQDNFVVGGAELSNHLVIKVGVDCGYWIDLVTPSTDLAVMRVLLSESDIIVLNNIWGFSRDQMRAILESVYADRKFYIKYEHDHRELGRIEFSRRLFQNSRLNVFLSPVHLKNHQEALGCGGIVLPLAIDVNLFKPTKGIDRKRNTAIVCNVRNFKLWTRLQKYIDDHPDIEFTVIAKDPVVHGQNVRAREKVPYEKMPELYSEFERVVHILDGWGAGERIVFEGALCGCQIIANEKVGHMSWEKDLTDVEGLRNWLAKAPYQFWKKIEEET